MRKTAMILSILGALFVAGAASASHLSDTYVIPVVAHVAGANNSTFATDLVITNFRNDPLTVQLIVIESGENQTDNVFPLTTAAVPNGSVVIQPGGTLLLKDVLNGHRGLSNVSGALLLGGSAPFVATARIYDTSRNSLGQTIIPSANFLENSTGRSDNASVAYLPGLVSTGTVRTNIGLVAGTGTAGSGPLVVEVTVKNGAGVTLGKRVVTLQPGTFTQVQFSVGSFVNQSFEVGSAEVRILGGSGAVIPYASIVDTASGEAAYVMGFFPDATPFTSSAFQPNIFRELLSRMSGAQY